MMAAADGWIMQRGVATDMCKGAIPSCQALSALFQITGDVDVPGGMISPPSILAYYNGWGGENMPQAQWDKRLGISKYPLYKYGFKNAPTYLDFEYKKDEKGMLREGGNVGFQTATGRIELWSTYFNQVGMDPVPSFEEPTPGPVANPDMHKDYPLGHESGQVPADGVWSSDHEAIVNRENVSEDVLADATTHTYNASKEIKAAPELYSIDGGRFGERAREIEAEKEAERQAAREELAAKITGMDKEQQA